MSKEHESDKVVMGQNSKNLIASDYLVLAGSFAMALSFHLSFLVVSGWIPQESQKPKLEPVQIKVVKLPEVEKLKVVPPEEKPPEEKKKEEPKTKPKPKKEEKVVKKTPAKKLPPKNMDQAPPKNVNPDQVIPPVQGLVKSALGDSAGPGVAVAEGNTLLTEDDGTRVKEVPPLPKDQSASANCSISEPPVFTTEAQDAGIEGVFKVDVFVDQNGAVKDVELQKKVGFGMDESIANAVKKAKCAPQLDKLGRSQEAWTTVTIRLVIN